MDYLTLRELTCLIKSTIDSTLPDECWVTAEVSQISCHLNSGHCYMEIVEKQDNATAAKMRANIWARDFRQISVNFRNLTGQELQAGMKILILAKVTYHEVHGLSLNIRDIEPRYAYLYSDDELKEFVPSIQRVNKRAKVTFAMFNNCHGGFAMKDALRLKELLASKEVADVKET